MRDWFTRVHHRRINPVHHTLAIGLYLLAAAIPTATRYVSIVVGHTDLYIDAREHWRPIAHQLATGDVLYVTTQFDNKTPLFHGLNYLVYQTGHYTPVFYLLVVLTNATVAYLLYRWLATDGLANRGLLAGFVYLAALPHLSGGVINVRSFALVALLAALFTTSPLARGGWLAIATLFSQLFVFAIPAIWYDGLRTTDTHTPLGWTLRYATAGLVVGGLAFAPLALVWGPDTLTAGINAAFLSVDEYVLHRVDSYSLTTAPLEWARALVSVTRRLVWALLPAAVGVGYVARPGRDHWDALTVSTVLAASFVPTLLLKSLPYYWLPIIAFLGPLAAHGVIRTLTARTAATENATPTE